MKYKITLLLLIFLIPLFVKAAATNKLEIVESNAQKALADNQGLITKKIIDKDLEKGEVTIELNVANTSTNKGANKDTEVYIIISENIKNDSVKLTKYLTNIQTLSEKILSYNSNTKIGIIGIKGPIKDTTSDEESGNLIIGPNDESDVPGNQNDAEIVVNPTNNVSNLITGVTNMNQTNTNFYNNFQAAIKLANNSYSSNVNKILISLYDEVPMIAIGVKNKISYGGFLNPYSTSEEANSAKFNEISTKVYNEIMTLKASNVSFILLRPGDTSYNFGIYDSSTGHFDGIFDGSAYVQKIYGTIENPSYGTMYLFDDTTLDSIIVNDMFHDITKLIQADMSNVKVVDYFPEEILGYFDFTYVGNPSVGSVTDSIDEDTRSLTWTINNLAGSETATLKYKLSIKDIQSNDLLEKVLATNEKVELTYNTNDKVELTDSPKIKLVKIAEDLDQPTANVQTGGLSVKTLVIFVPILALIIYVLKRKQIINKI